jgi:hypothetical protein
MPRGLVRLLVRRLVTPVAAAAAGGGAAVAGRSGVSRTAAARRLPIRKRRDIWTDSSGDAGGIFRWSTALGRGEAEGKLDSESRPVDQASDRRVRLDQVVVDRRRRVVVDRRRRVVVDRRRGRVGGLEEAAAGGPDDGFYGGTEAETVTGGAGAPAYGAFGQIEAAGDGVHRETRRE